MTEGISRKSFNPTSGTTSKSISTDKMISTLKNSFNTVFQTRSETEAHISRLKETIDALFTQKFAGKTGQESPMKVVDNFIRELDKQKEKGKIDPRLAVVIDFFAHMQYPFKSVADGVSVYELYSSRPEIPTAISKSIRSAITIQLSNSGDNEERNIQTLLFFRKEFRGQPRLVQDIESAYPERIRTLASERSAAEVASPPAPRNALSEPMLTPAPTRPRFASVDPQLSPSDIMDEIRSLPIQLKNTVSRTIDDFSIRYKSPLKKDRFLLNEQFRKTLEEIIPPMYRQPKLLNALLMDARRRSPEIDIGAALAFQNIIEGLKKQIIDRPIAEQRPHIAMVPRPETGDSAAANKILRSIILSFNSRYTELSARELDLATLQDELDDYMKRSITEHPFEGKIYDALLSAIVEFEHPISPKLVEDIQRFALKIDTTAQ